MSRNERDQEIVIARPSELLTRFSSIFVSLIKYDAVPNNFISSANTIIEDAIANTPSSVGVSKRA
ncbi:hypothetical protein KUL17_13020 [Alteromonas sp. KUL17]|nr:hypothetical protein KUL17_13020 [Alteromonas sp. KUL17]